MKAAADAVNLTQPALTQALARIELLLGQPLFERRHDGMIPTSAADLLVPRIEAALDHVASPHVTMSRMRALLALADTGSYNGASAATGLSLPSLHRAVNDLSLALRRALVERRGRSVLLTEAGLMLARAFRLARVELQSGLDELAAPAGQENRRVVIGAMPLSRARWLPEVIARFAALHPQIDIAVHEGSHTELVGPLRDGDIDLMLGALREGARAEDLDQVPVFEDRPALVMRAGHPLLAQTDDVAAAMFAYPWLMPGRDTPLRGYWEGMIRTLGRDVPRVGVECGSVMMLRQLLLSGDALTLLSPDQVSVELDAGVLAALPTPVPVTRTIGIATRAGWRPTAAQAAFVTLLEQVGRELAS